MHKITFSQATEEWLAKLERDYTAARNAERRDLTRTEKDLEMVAPWLKDTKVS